jgi:hypothetical protein
MTDVEPAVRYGRDGQLAYGGLDSVRETPIGY